MTTMSAVEHSFTEDTFAHSVVFLFEVLSLIGALMWHNRIVRLINASFQNPTRGCLLVSSELVSFP